MRQRLRKLSLTLVASALFFCLSVEAQNSDSSPTLDFNSQLQKAVEWCQQKNFVTADFYLARLLAQVARDNSTQTISDVMPALKERKLNIKNFIPKEYDADFVRWFEKNCNQRWDRPDLSVNEALGSVEIYSLTSGNYFVSVLAFPQIERWQVYNEQLESKPVYLATISSAKKRHPTMIVGKLIGQEMKSFRAAPIRIRRPIVNFWAPLFYDLDKDGTPEVFLRYNMEVDTGFSQVLEIYKVIDDSYLEIMESFRGDQEGVARFLPPNQIQVAHGFGSRAGLSRFQLDKHRVELHEFNEGRFVAKPELTKTVDHLLKSPNWKKYYFDS